MRTIKLAMTALFAVLAFSAVGSTTASAFHPLFLTQSRGELLVLASFHRLSLLRGEVLGQLGLVGCELLLFHGWILHLSPLIHRIKILFETKCLLVIPATNTHKNCPPTIHIKILLGELGLLNAGTTGSSLHVVILLTPADGTGNFASFECEGERVGASGAIVGEIPENNELGEKQYNVERSEIETNFATINKSNQQAVTEIWLLGTLMEKIELKTEGIFGGKSSEEAVGVQIHAVNGAKVTISTTHK